MITFVCVLKSGGDFKLEHVARLARQIKANVPQDRKHEIICLTDHMLSEVREHDTHATYDAADGVKIEPLHLALPGWWSKLEIFKIPGPAIYLDLDTEIIGSLEPLIDAVESLEPNQPMMLRPWNKAWREEGGMASGIVGWSHDLRSVYAEIRDACAYGKVLFFYRATRMRFHQRQFTNDQRWMTWTLRHKLKKDIVALQDVLPAYVQSYKVDLERGKVPATGSIVCFHGKPRPWDVAELTRGEQREGSDE